MKLLFSKWAAGIFIFTAVALTAFGESYTLDFCHPDGKGSSYPKAIPLSRAGSLVDDDGNAIGFMPATQSQQTGGRVSGARLTPEGLELTIDRQHSVMILGVPFSTWGGSMAEPVRVTVYAKFSDDPEWTFGDSHEYLGVGWGNQEANGEGTLSHVKVFGNEGKPNFHARSLDSDPSGTTGSLDNFSMAIETFGGKKFRGTFNEKYHTGLVSDSLVAVDNPDAWAFLFANRNGENQFKVLIKAITFEGPGITIPE